MFRSENDHFGLLALAGISTTLAHSLNRSYG